MLYLDYAKKMDNGYILNFFADEESDIAEVADGKEFITKNGTNYGVPLASSTVVVTMPDKSRKTYVLNEEGTWTIGGEKSGTEVEANVPYDYGNPLLHTIKIGSDVYNINEYELIDADTIHGSLKYEEDYNNGIIEGLSFNGENYYNSYDFEHTRLAIFTVDSETLSTDDGVWIYNISKIVYKDENYGSGGVYTDQAGFEEFYNILFDIRFQDSFLCIIKKNNLLNNLSRVVTSSNGFALVDCINDHNYVDAIFMMDKDRSIKMYRPINYGQLLFDDKNQAYIRSDIKATAMTLYVIECTESAVSGDRNVINLPKMPYVFNIGAAYFLGIGEDGSINTIIFEALDDPTKEAIATISKIGSIAAASGGTQTILLEGTYTEQTVEEVTSTNVALAFNSREEYINMCKEYIAGNINIRIVAKPTTSNASTLIYDVVFINDMTYTNGNAGYYLYTAIPNTNINWSIKNA